MENVLVDNYFCIYVSHLWIMLTNTLKTIVNKLFLKSFIQLL